MSQSDKYENYLLIFCDFNFNLKKKRDQVPILSPQEVYFDARRISISLFEMVFLPQAVALYIFALFTLNELNR